MKNAIGPGPKQKTKLKRQIANTAAHPIPLSPVFSNKLMHPVIIILIRAKKQKVARSSGRRPQRSITREETRTPTTVIAQTKTLAKAAPKLERPTERRISKAKALIAIEYF